MLNTDIAKIESTGGHIGIMRIIEITKIINRRPYWKFANYRGIKRKLTGGHIKIMLIIDIAKIE